MERQQTYFPDEKNYPLLFYSLMAALVMTWPAIYRPQYGNGWSMLSHTIQHFIFFGFLYLIDARLYSKRIRFLISGSALLYPVIVIFNSIIMSSTSITFMESMKIFAHGGRINDFLLTMKEAGFHPAMIPLLLFGLLLIMAAGSWLRHILPEIRLKPGTKSKIALVIFIASPVLFFLEQASSRNSPAYFARREYPLYLQIFSENAYTLRARMPRPHSEAELIEMLGNITPPLNPQNVVLIMLESFRWDVVADRTAVNMKNLVEEGLDLKNTRGDAIFTSLTWNVVYMDRPAWKIDSDIRAYNHESPASLPLRIFKKAGYDTYYASSANLEWNNFRARISGKQEILDHIYCAYSKEGPIERNILDNLTAKQAVNWINNARRPFVMLVQLDSTHWTYYFDKEAERYRPFPETINMLKLSTPEGIRPVFNRYKNAVVQVDNKIGEIIRALKAKNLYDRTAFVVVSDHGEGFAPGRIGHSVLHDDIIKIPILMRLPSLGHREIDTPASHRDIIPTLLNYLGFSGISKKLLLGHSLLQPPAEKKAVLTVHGSLLMAELKHPDYKIHFRTTVCGRHISFTPYRFFDARGEVVEKEEDFPHREDWRYIIKNIVEGVH